MKQVRDEKWGEGDGWGGELLKLRLSTVLCLYHDSLCLCVVIEDDSLAGGRSLRYEV